MTIKNIKSVVIDSFYNRIKIKTDTFGIGEVKIRCSNRYGQSSRAKIKLEIFNNKPPIAKCRIKKLENNWIKIDASPSRDQDQKYGGEIVKYEYKIGDYNQTTSIHYIKYRFSNSGSYNIKLRVQDNDGNWSKWYSTVVSI